MAATVRARDRLDATPAGHGEAVEEGERYSERFIPALMDVLTNSGVAPTLVAFAFVTAFLHYQLDRAVFRLSNPEVRRAVAKMLVP